VEKATWISFKIITTIFLGNHNFDMVADLVQSYEAMRRNMSLKVHLLGSCLNFFPENLSGQWEVNMESDFSRIFPPRKGDNKASGVPV